MKKLTNKKGFTLMEMIIVIAIIVILAAISIPTLTGNLDSANKATDAANLRAAKSAALVQDMNDDLTTGTKYYNATTGEFDANGTACGKCENHDGKKIVATIEADGSITVEWEVTGHENSCD